MSACLRILAVGNSYSFNALHYVPRIARQLGCEAEVGILYRGGCSLEQHVQFASSQEPAYWYFTSQGDEYDHEENCTFSSRFYQGEWDVVTLQQASHASGLPETYGEDLDVLIGLAQKAHPKAKLFWHMTWPYENGCPFDGFKTYGCDAGQMYEAIVGTVKEKILPRKEFDDFLPAGTLIHRLSARFGGIFHNPADKLHLNANGEYAVAVLWACLLLGRSPEELSQPIEGISWELFEAVKEETARLLSNPKDL